MHILAWLGGKEPQVCSLNNCIQFKEEEMGRFLKEEQKGIRISISIFSIYLTL